MTNPLIEAIAAQDRLYEAQCEMMFEIAGDAAFEPYDELLGEAVADLIDRAPAAIEKLSPRAQQARLNLMWKGFVEEQILKTIAWG